MRAPSILLALASLLAAPAARAQGEQPIRRTVLAGAVTDAEGGPLAAVRVLLVEANRRALTDAAGEYAFADVPLGRHTVTFTRLGVTPLVQRVTLPIEGRLDVILQPSHVELPAVQAVATSTSGGVFASPQPVSVLELGGLRTAHGSSVGDALEGLPGLRSLSMSPGIGKPVIRGLTSNRVVVIDDGQRLETQQWGSDHAPNVETIGASRIEVLRGPASVLYGSDALGGVVNIVRPPPPDAIGSNPFLRMRAGNALHSNPRGVEATLTGEGASGGVGTRISFTRRTTDDVRTPVANLHNTGNAASNLDATAGYRGDRIHGQLGTVIRSERIEIYEDPEQFPGFTGYQRILENRLNGRLSARVGAHRLELMLTHERNERREFEDVLSPHVALGLLARTVAAQLSYHHRPLLGFGGTIGLSLLDDRFEKFGHETLIPSSSGRTAAVFVFEQAELGRWTVSAGARLDGRRLAAEADSALGLAAESRSWRAVTGNAGVLYRLSGPLALVLNVGRGFRAPSAADLFSNGYHEGTRAFEVGDPSLGVETSLNADLALRMQTSVLHAEIGTFANRIRDYIYLRPVGSLDTLVHAQGDALLRGVEAYADYAPTVALAFRFTADIMRGQNASLDVPLPLIPPARASVRVRVQSRARGMLQAPYGAVTWEGHGAQRRLHPGDVGTAGYGLVHLAAGGVITGERRVLTVDLLVRNALDHAHRNFMSAYKTIANAPARSVTLRLGMDF